MNDRMVTSRQARVSTNRFLAIAFTLFFASVFVIAQSTAPKPVSSKGVLKWVSPTTDIEGDAETLASAEVAITAPAVVNLNTSGTPLRIIVGLDPDGTKGYVIAPLVASLPRGPYKVWARVVDDAGNISAWSEVPAEIQLDAVAPKPPTGVSCK